MTKQTPLFLKGNDLMVNTPNGNYTLHKFKTFSEALNSLDMPILVITENVGENKVKIWDNTKNKYITRKIGGSVYVDKCYFTYNGKKYRLGRPNNQTGNGIEKGYWIVWTLQNVLTRSPKYHQGIS